MHDRISSTIEQWSKLITKQLGEDLIGFYKIGSLAHGGFSERYSDIDLAIIVKNVPEVLGTQVLQKQLIKASSEFGPRLSIFWGDQALSKGRFPLIDQLDYHLHAKTIIGQKHPLISIPKKEQIREEMMKEWIPYWENKTKLMLSGPIEEKSLLKIALYPARLYYTWETGKLASNQEAVAFLKKQKLSGIDTSLMEQALDIREKSKCGDAFCHLFNQRHVLQANLNTVIEKTKGTKLAA